MGHLPICFQKNANSSDLLKGLLYAATAEGVCHVKWERRQDFTLPVHVANFILSLLDYLLKKRFDIGQELSNKLHCIRFILGLLEHQQADVSSSQETSSGEQSSEDESESRLLGCDCLKFFDKIVGIYPFSSVEKSHMRSILKLQVS